ncbi:MAG: cell division protein FtsZ [Chitinophagaceae bacterium]|nr:MAG: cell division protein FtsZ [Chitinophagaceae bacterium]
MIHFDLPKEKSSIIKVIGVGGGGSNAVNHMHSQQIEGVDFIICNTDAQAIAKSDVPNKIQLGPHLTQGLGAGANPEIGRQATEESLEEIRRILEVNTKMAFVTAGMGGGTGTGGAPIISKICKDLGILTVGIVTTPFAYEGKKRMQQAEEGIKNLKQYVDTLLVISNDKLRHQFGNLKMRDAFAKADNVLATAAKCITDVISSTGQINVDFADVCTVMKNGCKAILGNAAAAGENRAQRAIEEALNSPLLNDNDIRGAKWVLININSAEGEHEFTMDEVEIIQNYLVSQAGENSDVILGLGYDNSLGENIGITIIATGYQQSNSIITAKAEKKVGEPEKIMMILDEQIEEKIAEPIFVDEKIEDLLAPRLIEHLMDDNSEYEVNTENKTQSISEDQNIIIWDNNGTQLSDAENKIDFEADEVVNTNSMFMQNIENGTASTSGGYLLKPSNIYATAKTSATIATKQVVEKVDEVKFDLEKDAASLEMQLIEKECIEEPLPQICAVETNVSKSAELLDEVEDQKRRTVERIQKLRNLSFNINSADPNNEFEMVPAYVRRNMELYGNSISTVENFYSNYEVKLDDNSNIKISSINTFLDGKKPD